MIKTDVVVIGAGPVGLFAVHQLGIIGLKAEVIDNLDKAGGQCIELYPDKPIYDIPGIPECTGESLTKSLLQQIKPFKTNIHLNERVQSISKENNEWKIETNKKNVFKSPNIIIAGGVGSFEPRKFSAQGIERFENNTVLYSVKNKSDFKNKKVCIFGGGDSALDWAIELSKFAKVTLVHRRNEFRGADDSVASVQKLKDLGKIDVITPAQVEKLNGKSKLESIIIDVDGNKSKIETDYFIPLFGLVPKLGPIKDWGLKIENNAIKVNNSLDYQTNIDGIYAIGDVNTYPGKLKLILSGFHEAAVMCHSAYSKLNPDKKNRLMYTTVSGIEGFDGSKKEAKKSQKSKID